MLTDRKMIVPTFAGGTLDRADQVRVNPDKLRAAMMNPRAKLLKLDGLNPVFDDYGDLAWGAAYEASPDNDLLLLGIEGDTSFFAELNGAGMPAPPPTGRCGRHWEACPPIRRQSMQPPAVWSTGTHGINFARNAASRPSPARAVGRAFATARMMVAEQNIFRAPIRSRSCCRNAKARSCWAASHAFRQKAFPRWPGFSSRGKASKVA